MSAAEWRADDVRVCTRDPRPGRFPAAIGLRPRARILEGANLLPINVLTWPADVGVVHISHNVVRTGEHGAMDGKPVLMSVGRHVRSPQATGPLVTTLVASGADVARIGGGRRPLVAPELDDGAIPFEQHGGLKP